MKDVLYSFQASDGYGIIGRHTVKERTDSTVVIDERPDGYEWRSNLLALSRDELEVTGQATVHREVYYTEPQDDWWGESGPPTLVNC